MRELGLAQAMDCVREKGMERYVIPEALTVPRPRKQEKMCQKLPRDPPQAQLSKETKPKANAFKLLHWQWDAQGGSEGLSNPLQDSVHVQRGSG